jgi:hypothetical protein
MLSASFSTALEQQFAAHSRILQLEWTAACVNQPALPWAVLRA